tara:strand:- start:99 stop:275 length:177 start_codon:yes stop_codon:yes gene_type:complete
LHHENDLKVLDRIPVEVFKVKALNGKSKNIKGIEESATKGFTFLIGEFEHMCVAQHYL